MLLDNIIYGTFPDLPGSQQVVHKTAGITSQIETELLKFYNEFGDCRNESFQTSISVLWLKAESDDPLVAVSRVSQMGRDFSGRWGALLRHTAVLSRSQYRQFLFDPGLIEPLLVSSGSSEELSAFGDMIARPLTSAAAFLTDLCDYPVDKLKTNLHSLMKGERMLIYSDINSEHTNRYLRRLLNLLPFSFKMELSWSEFLFRSHERFDLQLIYNGRYEAPTTEELQFTRSAAGKLSQIELHPDYISDYIELLEAALAGRDLARLGELICDLPG